MPIYEYICKGCTTHFEELRWNSDTAGVTCPECSGEHVNRVLSSFSVGSVTEQSLPSCASQIGNGGCCGGACAHS